MTHDPFILFATWFDELKITNVKEPTAMTLATASKAGRPSSRIVLLKNFDQNGFVFFTNSQSRKGRELHDNPYAALSLYWMDMQRQIRIEGRVEEVTGKEADDYYASRHLESRIGAWASKQSEKLANRAELERRVREFSARFGNNPPRPPHWYGYRLIPDYFEFWKEGAHRLHDRDCFELKDGKWENFRLYP